MKKSKKRLPDSSRATLIQTLYHHSSFESHVVISAIQGLWHVSETGDEKYLIPLLDCNDTSIAAAALSMLSTHYSELPFLTDRIIEFASTYPHGCEDNSELQIAAIFALERLAASNERILKILIEIAECDEPHSDSSEALFANVAAWESLARLGKLKLSGEEIRELHYNPHGVASNTIRKRIEKSVETTFCS